ncbi:unnamed protein product [Rotaria sp. Silwood1]|nr:unnamed protein product [Rotaria sp. Silwood1]
MKCSMETTDEGNVFNKFKIELRLLWAECQVDNELDFDRVAQQLFDDDLKVLEEIKENALEDKFLYFQHELLESERFKEIWKAKNLPKSNHTDRAFIEFKTVIMKIFETENIKPNTVDLDLLMQQLYQNEDQNIADLFKNILIPKKIKQLITKIQSNEALKTIWPSNMLIFGDIKSIFKKYINFGDSNEDEIKKIISELYVNADNGMKLIEDKCSSEKFSKIKSELYGNAEIRSKIFHEKNLIKLPNIDNKNNVVMLSSTTVHSAHENEQNKKFETIRELQEIMFGREDNYPDQLFTEILPLNYHSLGETIKNSLNKMSMLDMMLPYVLNKLKKGIALSEICELEIFWDEVSPLFGMDYKTIFICMIERYKRYQLDIVALIKKLGIALPFAYRWVVNQKLIFKIPLRAYSYSLDIDCPMVISLGSGCIGKSTLLNKIYSAQFITNRAGKITGGIDVIFSTPEFACGFTIFDIHDDAYEQEALLEVFFKMIPIENCWILLQSTSADEKNKIIEKLKLFGTTNGQIIWIVRDCKESTYQSTQTLKDNSQIQVLSIRKIEENNPQFNANLAVLREKLFKSTGIGHNSRKPNEINLRKESDNLYREIETRLGQQQLPGIHIDMQDESVGKCSIWTDEYLRSTDGIMDNLQAHLFKHVEFNKLIQAEEKKKAGLSGTDSQTKQTEITKIDQAKIHFSDKKASTKPSTLVKIFTTRPIIIFILRNMMDLNVNKQREMIDTVKKELKEVSELNFVYNKSEELFQKSTTNTKFAKLSQELTERIFSEAKAPDPRFKSLSDWVKQASEIWKTIDLYNDIIMIESIKEINERKELSDIVTKIMETLIEPSDEQTSYRSKLETILTQQEKLINNSSPVDSDVEQRFENETKIFQEKVKNNFENQIKSKSYAVKLTNEYKDRLLSAITTSKTQALQKFKAIAEKGKLKYKIDVALSQLQNRSEKQILDWQKAEQNTSTEHKTHLKIKIIKEFEEVMKKTISDTVKEMNTSKKTHEQWENFVMEQIKSAHGTIPDNKNNLKFNLTADVLKEKDKIKAANQQKALGCIEQCPYCGCKCTEIVNSHDAHHSNNHRLMAFNGSFEKTTNGKKGFVFDLCNSENTIKHSRWKENSQSQLTIRDSKVIRERMNEYSVGEGDVTITLAWFDSNDLDLHVTCPCGTELYFRNPKVS